MSAFLPGNGEMLPPIAFQSAGAGPQRRALARRAPRRAQRGITVIGFLILASLFGIVGFAALKLFPMYIQNMRLATVLEDVRDELDGTNTTAGQIRVALTKRFDVEGIRLPPESVKIDQARNGYEVSVLHDNRAPFIADIWFLVTFDKQIEIRR